jgi:hypothetical protein
VPLAADVALEGKASSDLGVAVAVPIYPYIDNPSPVESSSMKALELEWIDVPDCRIEKGLGETSSIPYVKTAGFCARAVEEQKRT